MDDRRVDGVARSYPGLVRCPTCRADETKVVDSRLASDGDAVRRRRECVRCTHRFTTYERPEETPLLVTKSNGRVEPFDRDKVIVGVAASTKGRAVSPADVDALANDVEDSLRLCGSSVTSSSIGLAVLERLRELDEVAYLRFASVYKNFDAAADFQSELELLRKPANQPGDESATPTDNSDDAAVNSAVESPTG